MSEYDPLFSVDQGVDGDESLEEARKLFADAGSAFLRSPLGWLAWALLLPAAALVTPAAAARGGPVGVAVLWSAAILVGGLVEGGAALRHRGSGGAGGLARWVLRGQGNLSLVAVALSLGLLWEGLVWLLPAVWLLLLGHSFFFVGGLSFKPLKVSGLLYQAGGLVALWPGGGPLLVFAVTTLLANLWMAWSVYRRSAGPVR